MADTKLTTVKIIKDIYSKFDLHVYPSPAVDVLNIATFDNMLSISVYTIDGKLVKVQEANSSTNTMDVSNLAAGMYMIQVITEEETLQTKFSKR